VSYLARLRIEIYHETDDGKRPLVFVEEGATLTNPSGSPYEAVAELTFLLDHAKVAINGQAREIAGTVQPQEVRT
jgi:hypothetical protein